MNQMEILELNNTITKIKEKNSWDGLYIRIKMIKERVNEIKERVNEVDDKSKEIIHCEKLTKM